MPDLVLGGAVAAGLPDMDGQEALRLIPREWGLLAALARDGRVVTQRHLLATVWATAHLEDTRYLPVYIAQLRQKLAEAAFLIRTEPGVGSRSGEACSHPSASMGRAGRPIAGWADVWDRGAER